MLARPNTAPTAAAEPGPISAPANSTGRKAVVMERGSTWI